MTPSLEWTGYVPAAVSAVHALGALARLCRQSAVSWKTTRSQASRGTRKARHSQLVTQVLVVRWEIAEVGTVEAEITVDVAPAASGRAAGRERGPW